MLLVKILCILAYFFHKNFPDMILYQLTKFTIRSTFLLKISNNVSLCSFKFLFSQLITSIILWFIFHHSSGDIADKEKKSGWCKYKGLNIMRTKKAFWMRLKAFFIIFWWKIHLVKKEMQRTQASTFFSTKLQQNLNRIFH